MLVSIDALCKVSLAFTYYKPKNYVVFMGNDKMRLSYECRIYDLNKRYRNAL